MALETFEGLINITEMNVDQRLGAPPKSPITELFETLSSHTWLRLKYSIPMNISQGEETITDINLLDIKLSGVKGIKIWKCPKKEEGKRGIDWQWLIGNDKVGWRSYLVQAKKLQLESGRYSTLGHKIRDKFQIDILAEAARRECSFPLYCFYNYVEFRGKDPGEPFWNCPTGKANELQLGCTVTPLRIVRDAMNRWGKRTFQNIHAKGSPTLPWRCLVSCDHAILQYHDPKSSANGCEKSQLYKRYSDIPREIRQLFSQGSAGETELPQGSHLVSESVSNLIFSPRRIAVMELEYLTANREDELIDQELPIQRDF